MLKIEGNAHTRVITDDQNPRIHVVEHKCARCRFWMHEDDTVWVPNWSEGKPYHTDCAPAEEEDDLPTIQIPDTRLIKNRNA